jgi:hypothetical protein
MHDFGHGTADNRRRSWQPPPDVMSCEEIRAWFIVLLPIWGSKLLNRTMAFRGNLIVAKTRWMRIYPTEQVRCSQVLKRILSGELVPIRGRRGRGGAGRAVIADHPVPFRRLPNISFNFKTGETKLVPREVLPKLPSFKSLLENPPRSIWYGRDA